MKPHHRSRDSSRSRSRVPRNRRAPQNRRRSPAAAVESASNRRGLWTSVGAVLGGAALVAAAGTALVFGYASLVRSDRLQVRRVEVSGLERASRSAVIRQAGIEIGSSILEVDLDRTAVRVRAHPWVKTATVNRVFPDRVGIDVVERVPAAVVALDGLYLADTDGVVFKRLESDDSFDAPILTGLSLDRVTEFPERTAEEIRRGIALAEELGKASRDLGPLDEIHHDAVLGWSVVLRPPRLDRKPVVVRLGQEPRGRWSKLTPVLREAARRGIRPQSIDLANEKKPNRVRIRVHSAPKTVAPRPNSDKSIEVNGQSLAEVR